MDRARYWYRGCVTITALLGAVGPFSYRAYAGRTSIASVRAVIHRLTVVPAHQGASPAHLRQQLFAADGLRTAAQDKASIMFSDKAVLHINHRTDLVLRSPKLTTVSRGEVDVIDTPGSVHHIQTATAVATALGTRFDVRIERAQTTVYPPTPSARTFPPGTTTVSVVKGVVRVSNSHGTVRVQAGHWTHVAPGKAPTTPTRHNARGDVAWTSGLTP